MDNLKDILEENGVKIAHHFSAGVYVKETFIPAGITLTKHTHSYTHLSVKVSGKAEIEKDGVMFLHDGYLVFTVEAGLPHKVTAVTDTVWLCVHATDDDNPDTVDISLMSRLA